MNACKDERITDVSITAPVPAVLIFPPSLSGGPLLVRCGASGGPGRVMRVQTVSDEWRAT